MSISLVDHWPFGVSWGRADEIVVRLGFCIFNRGANSEPFKEDYNEALHENTSKIMLCDSTSVPMYASTVSYAPHATLIRTFSNGLPAKR